MYTSIYIYIYNSEGFMLTRRCGVSTFAIAVAGRAFWVSRQAFCVVYSGYIDSLV